MELSIDTVGMQSSVAVSEAGCPVVEISWRTGRRHTPSLVPTVDEAVRRAGIDREALTAVFVDVGPGAYGGIRAGMATATGIALALSLPAVGVGRLEIEAYAHAAAGAVAAIHAAGRRQWAFARYEGARDRGPAAAWRELSGPRLVSLEGLIEELRVGEAGVCCGEPAALPEEARLALQDAGLDAGDGARQVCAGRACLAELGWQRLEAARADGDDLSPARLQPIYLREPAIGPQPPPETSRDAAGKEKTR